MPQTDYYQLLGVDKTAAPKQLKEAYRKLAFEYHPDRNQGNLQASEKMKQINEAYAVLSDPSKKREYDMFREQFGSSAYSKFRSNYSEQDIFSGSDIHHVFEEMAKAFKRPGFFAGGIFFTGPFGKTRLDPSLLSSSGKFGKLSSFLLKQISGFELQKNGKDIHDVVRLRKKSKKLVVKIPPGVKEGQRIRLTGMGETGKGGGKPGDLFLKVQIKTPLLKKIKKSIADLRNR